MKQPSVSDKPLNETSFFEASLKVLKDAVYCSSQILGKINEDQNGRFDEIQELVKVHFKNHGF